MSLKYSLILLLCCYLLNVEGTEEVSSDEDDYCTRSFLEWNDDPKCHATVEIPDVPDDVQADASVSNDGAANDYDDDSDDEDDYEDDDDDADGESNDEYGGSNEDHSEISHLSNKNISSTSGFLSEIIQRYHEDYNEQFDYDIEFLCFSLSDPSEIVYYNFGVYYCEKSSRTWLFLHCQFGNYTISQTQVLEKTVGNRSYTSNPKDSNFCIQIAHQYVVSLASYEKNNIRSLQSIVCSPPTCSDKDCYNFIKPVAYYNFKVVECQKLNYFRFIGCLFDEHFNHAEDVLSSGLEIAGHDPDICLQYGLVDPDTVSDNLLLKSNGYHYGAVDNEPVNTITSIKETHEKYFCKKIRRSYIYHRIFYDFGLYWCQYGELVLRSCVYGDKVVAIAEVKQKIQAKKFGEYIDDVNDLRFCSQVAEDYLPSGKPHQPSNLWKIEEYMCKTNFRKTLRRFKNAIYQNFKVLSCQNIRQHVQSRRPVTKLEDCLYDKKSTKVSDVASYYRTNGKEMSSLHRDFCFKYGRKNNLINFFVVDARLRNLEAGLERSCSINKWENNVIPYAIDRRLGSHQRRAIKTAMDKIAMKTCIRFRPISRSQTHIINDYVVLVPSQDDHACWADVGKIGGMQMINLVGINCITHELLHTIGIRHEHQRPDRDNWIDMNMTALYRTVKPFHRLRTNYFACRTSNNVKLPYNTLSIMHYNTRGARYQKFHLWDKKLTNIAGSKKITNCDIAQINQLYGCDARRYRRRC